MPKPKITLSMETLKPTENQAMGRMFIEALCETDSRLVPELVSDEERFVDPFIDNDNFVESWWAKKVVNRYHPGSPPIESYWGPMWKRKSALASRGSFDHGGLTIKYNVIPSRTWLECRWANDVDFVGLFEKWTDILEPYFGMVHIFNGMDQEFCRPDGPDSQLIPFSSCGLPENRHIGNAGWAMVFGGSYATECDAERISKAGFRVDQFNSTFVIRVTDNIADVIDNFPYFSERRVVLKSLFRDGLFRVMTEPD